MFVHSSRFWNPNFDQHRPQSVNTPLWSIVSLQTINTPRRLSPYLAKFSPHLPQYMTIGYDLWFEPWAINKAHTLTYKFSTFSISCLLYFQTFEALQSRKGKKWAIQVEGDRNDPKLAGDHPYLQNWLQQLNNSVVTTSTQTYITKIDAECSMSTTITGTR